MYARVRDAEEDTKRKQLDTLEDTPPKQVPESIPHHLQLHEGRLDSHDVEVRDLYSRLSQIEELLALGPFCKELKPL